MTFAHKKTAQDESDYLTCNNSARGLNAAKTNEAVESEKLWLWQHSHWETSPMKNRLKPDESRRRTAQTKLQMELSMKLIALGNCLSPMRLRAQYLENEKLRSSRYSALASSISAVLDCLQRKQKATVGSEKEMWANAHLRLTKCVDSITDILKPGAALEIHELAQTLKSLEKRIDGSLRFIYDILNTRQAAEGD